VRDDGFTSPRGISRRRLLKGAATGGVAVAAAYAVGVRPGSGGLLLPGRGVSRALASVQLTQTPLAGASIPKYVDRLPVFAGNRVDGTKNLVVTMREFTQRVLPSSVYEGLEEPFDVGTFLWGYGASDGRHDFDAMFPAVTIEAKRGTPTVVRYVNKLGTPTTPPRLQETMTIDQTLHWANPLGIPHHDPRRMDPYFGPAPAVVHLHGAEVPSAFDGFPSAWFTPGKRGSGQITGDDFATQSYAYPNLQEAAALWFHDHTLGATRLNVYCGLAGFYILRDHRDTGRRDNPIGLPGGVHEVELMIADRQFDTNGQLMFPDGSPEGINGPPPNPETHPFWNPEFFGDAIVVNGKTWPFLEVEPRRYRFRFLDGSNARFYELSLVDAASAAPGPAFWQIGTDGGLLDAPVKLNDPASPSSLKLLLAPSERADIIIDFSGSAGRTLTMMNSANAPYPGGDPVDPDTTGQVMQFRVNRPLSGRDTTYNPASGAPLRSPMVRLVKDGALVAGGAPHVTRQLVLNEVEGDGGPEMVLLNNSTWEADTTESPRVGATELWEIVNTTEDAHPVHIHLVQFQLMDRQDFSHEGYEPAYAAAFPGGVVVEGAGPPLPYGSTAKLGGNPDVTPYLLGAPRLPDVNETGWKDTIKAYPGTVTRVMMRYAPQHVAIGGAGPGVNRYAFDPTRGPGYVWHCHILDHEDNEMMRPQQVVH